VIQQRLPIAVAEAAAPTVCRPDCVLPVKCRSAVIKSAVFWPN
jgi:hypothetical protein